MTAIFRYFLLSVAVGFLVYLHQRLSEEQLSAREELLRGEGRHA